MNEEILEILMEECAEIIQSITKMRRFGTSSVSPSTGETNYDSFVQELGDVTCMISLLVKDGTVDPEHLEEAAKRKLAKLKKFSNIPNL